MASGTLSEFLLPIVVWFSFITLVIMLLLLLNIFWLRIGLIARKRREQQFLDRWQPLLASVIAGEKLELPPLPKNDLLFFLKLWNHLHESLRGHVRRELNIIALRLRIVEYTYPLLSSRNRGIQLLALTTFGNLQDRLAWQDILKFARQPDPLISLTAAHTLFQIDPEAALKDLMQQLIERTDWPEAHMIVLLKEAASADIYTSLVSSAVGLATLEEPESRIHLHRLLRILHHAPYQFVITAIRTILSLQPDDESLAQCLKFLREPEDLPVVRTNVRHASWVVRLQAAQALGRFGAPEDMPNLAILISDPVWWVRYRAARAVIELTRGDKEKISQLRLSLHDNFALDMLNMALAEKGQS